MEKITTTGLRVRWHPVARPNCALLRVGHNIHRGHPSAVAPEKNHYMFQVPSSCVYYLGLVRPNEAENDEKVPGNLARFTPREPHRLEFVLHFLPHAC